MLYWLSSITGMVLITTIVIVAVLFSGVTLVCLLTTLFKAEKMVPIYAEVRDGNVYYNRPYTERPHQYYVSVPPEYEEVIVEKTADLKTLPDDIPPLTRTPYPAPL